MNLKRLNTLCDFMAKRRSRRHFNMKWWFTHKGINVGGQHGINFGQPIPADALDHCGTTACALGFAATVPSFRRAGLKVMAAQICQDNYYVACEFFGLTDNDFDVIFGPDNSDTTPAKWAKRVRAYLATQAVAA